MTKPQQPELARDRQGEQDQDGRELRVSETRPFDRRDSAAPVPDENAAGLDAVAPRDPSEVPDKPDHVHPALAVDASDEAGEADDA